MIVNRLRVVCLLSSLSFTRAARRRPGSGYSSHPKKKKRRRRQTHIKSEILIRIFRLKCFHSLEMSCWLKKKKLFESSWRLSEIFIHFENWIPSLEWKPIKAKCTHARSRIREHYAQEPPFFAAIKGSELKLSVFQENSRIFLRNFILCIPYAATHSPANKLANKKKSSKQIKLIPSICCYSERQKKYIFMRKSLAVWQPKSRRIKNNPFAVKMVPSKCYYLSIIFMRA